MFYSTKNLYICELRMIKDWIIDWDNQKRICTVYPQKRYVLTKKNCYHKYKELFNGTEYNDCLHEFIVGTEMVTKALNLNTTSKIISKKNAEELINAVNIEYQKNNIGKAYQKTIKNN